MQYEIQKTYLSANKHTHTYVYFVCEGIALFCNAQTAAGYSLIHWFTHLLISFLGLINMKWEPAVKHQISLRIIELKNTAVSSRYFFRVLSIFGVQIHSLWRFHERKEGNALFALTLRISQLVSFMTLNVVILSLWFFELRIFRTYMKTDSIVIS